VRTKAEQLVRLLRTALGSEAPIRVQAWDASIAGRAGAPLVRLRSREVLRRLLWEPNELVGGGLSFAEGRMGVEQILAARPAAQHGG
jgi:cyclopropane-fatty-acyl-phospholipid synthase